VIQTTEKSSQHEATKRKSIEEQLTEQLEYKPPKYVPPPKMPKPIKLKESLYPSGGVSRFEKSKRWGASVSLGGNDLFLGSFPTQTQAKGAIDMALENVATGKQIGPERAYLQMKWQRVLQIFVQ